MNYKVVARFAIAHIKTEGLKIVKDNGLFLRDISPTIFMSNFCSVGEALGKSSSCRAQNPSTCTMDNSKQMRLGKTKWFRNGKLLESNENSCRFTALLKRSEGGIVTSGLYRPSFHQHQS